MDPPDPVAGLRRPDLGFARLLAVWGPLAATFLLLSGATPIVNASINRLPGRAHEADLAAFAVFFACIIVIHSPLFVSREIAIRLSVDRAGSRRALRFCLGAAGGIALFEVLLGLTPLGRVILGAFTDRPGILREAHRAFLLIWPAPLLIAVRGVYQAHQIRVDDTLFVGLGSLARLALTALLGLVLAPQVGVPGPMLGAACIVLGIATETIFAVLRARARARPPLRSADTAPSPVRFALPLMFANFLGVFAGLFYLRIAGRVEPGAQQASLAGFQEVKSLQWLLTAGAMALQSLTTAKVRRPADAAPMLRFAAAMGGGLLLLFAAAAFTPLGRFILVDLMNERPGGDVVAFAGAAMMLACLMPLLQALRFTLRGVLIARSRTGAITVCNVTTLLLLSSAVAFDLLPSKRNGALNAYVVWTGALLVELALLARFARARVAASGPLPPPLRSPREASGG